MAANVQQAAAPVVAAQNNEPQPQVGGLDEREVAELRLSCSNRHAEKGKVMETLLPIIALIAGIWAGLLVGGVGGFFLACAIVLVGGPALNTIFNSQRNRDFLEASQALKTQGFLQFMADRRLDLSIDTIITVHKEYKNHLGHQVVNALQQARA